ncbi:MAG: Rrf2 family transcriptional regulator [Candidatus Omnitrophica bacterium]|nr:Rrf2 family transcriptional regulator [Candidatus Omnitrophota bacterium]
MKIITKDIDYALRSVIAMFKNKKGRWKIPELVKETKVSQPFLRKIMQILAKKGVVKTHKGRNGGFSLDNLNISMHDVICSFAEKVQLHEHLFNGKKCPRFLNCKVRAELDIMEKEISERLKKIKISDIVD